MDDNFKHMEKYLTATGSGRRVTVKKHSTLTMFLLLQLDHLRKTLHKSWDEMNDFFGKVCDKKWLENSALELEIRRANRATDSLLAKGGELETFLSTDVGLELEVRNVGQHLQGMGIKRRHLLFPESLTELELGNVSVTKGVVLELMMFQSEEGTTLRMLQKWLKALGLDTSSLSDKQLRSRLSKIKQPYDSMKKNISKPNTKKKLEDFLQSPAELFSPPAEPGSLSTPPSGSPGQASTEHAELSAKLLAYGRQMAAQRRELEEKTSQLARYRSEIELLQSVTEGKNQQLRDLQTNLDWLVTEKTAAKDQASQLREKLETSKKDLKKARETITSMKYQNYFVKLKRKENALNKQQSIIDQHKQDGCQKKIASLRKKLKNSQTLTSKYHLQSTALRAKLKAMTTDPIDSEEDDEDGMEMHLKDSKGHFLPEAKICIMQLVGENEVPAHRCGAVLKTAARLFGLDIPDTQLPSQRSALRFADQGQVVGKSHVAEVLSQADHWDLHVDGTSRGGKTYIGQQATTASGSLSMGFVPVATEDTSTLVDVSIQMLEELSELHPGGRDFNFYHILLGLSGVMTDRAAVMKSFGRKFEEERKELLQTDEGLEFLHCNAHFLLGLGAESRKALAADEKEKGEPLGRDSQPGFFSYNSDCSAYRLVT